MKNPAFRLTIIAALTAAVLLAAPSQAQSPSTQPLGVDNRQGSPTFHKITTITDFWSYNPVPLSAVPTIPANHTSGLEPALGNPTTNGYVLSKSTTGVVTWVAPGGAPDAATLAATLETARLYPVFDIPIGDGYCDIEFKITTDNFSTLVYWFATSSVVAASGSSLYDHQATVFYTDSDSADPRKWRIVPDGSSVYSLLADQTNSVVTNIILIPSKVSGSASYLFKGNTNLKFAYCRLSSVGEEKDALNRSVWHSTVPIEWRVAPYSPQQ